MLNSSSILNRIFRLKVTDYSKKGHGLAFLEVEKGKTPVKVEIPSAALGEHLGVKIEKRKRGGEYQAKILEIIEASDVRILPRCEHANSCGGCSWQHIEYRSQLEQKEKKIHALFGSIPCVFFHPIIPCENPWHYRNKMEFSFSEDKSGKKFLGLVETFSRRKVLNLNHCHLVSSWFIEIRQAVFEWWNRRSLKPFHPPSGTGSLDSLTLREGVRTGQRMVTLNISGDQDHFVKKTDLTTFKQAILHVSPKEKTSIYLRIRRAEKNRPTTFYEMHLHGPDALHETLVIKGKPFHFRISPDSFFQPNTLQAEKLYEKALDLAHPNGSMRVYDLYAGCGSIGMIFAPFVKKVLAIEQSAYAVCDAKVNIQFNQIDNMNIVCADVKETLSKFSLSADLIIVDPPRSGLDQAIIEQLLVIRPKKILYISCNPFTQSENIFTLIEHGYQLKAIQPVDQFPHTPHIETISLLEK